METNEICMSVDVKLAIHDKRPDYLRFKNWTRSMVKIEAVKCFPCFLRITIVPSDSNEEANDVATHDVELQLHQHQQQRSLNVPIIVPGVTVSLASSRTKQHSFGLFWKQNRRDCFIYFAIDTDVNCRRHIKWVKKSIRSLELYRQFLIEQRRSSRGPQRMGPQDAATNEDDDGNADDTEAKIEQSNDGNSWSRRVSHISNIYEEIGEDGANATPPRLSRRLSHTSIASGIYEEMKCTNNSFNAITEETPEPPPLPPLPMQRKRFNTFENDNCVGLLGEIPRSNTNPECEMAKKKKYKKVFENIFGSGRSKRTKSVSESQACSTEDVISCNTPKPNDAPESSNTPVYANEAAVIVTRKRHRKQLLAKSAATGIAHSNRNSFSSPDLSKINFLDASTEEKFLNGALANESLATSDDLDISSHSLDESSILAAKNGTSTNTSVADLLAQIRANCSKSGSLESLNISQQIPNNFNFSACNSSSINLMGAYVANHSVRMKSLTVETKLDDLSGYCFMAPLKKESAALRAENETESNKNSEMLINNLADYCFMAPIKKKLPLSTATHSQPESSSSGYSTGSYCSSTSSCTNSTEDHLSQRRPSAGIIPQTTPPNTLNEESVIYESMHLRSTNESQDEVSSAVPATMTDFSGNLYENLLTVKAAQELEQMPTALTTSTPTDSPHTEVQSESNPSAGQCNEVDGEENYYQTPRKSIISIDDKIPSYYPNSCDTVKTRRSSQTQSPSSSSAITPNSDRSTVSGNSVGLRHFVGIKTHRERRENQYISSPQSIIEQRHSSHSSNTMLEATHLNKNPNKSNNNNTSNSNKKTGAVNSTAAHKISENVCVAMHANSADCNTSSKRKSLPKVNKKDAAQTENAFNEELKEKLQKELLTMVMLQNIDFKFDDTKALLRAESTDANSATCIMQNEGEQENYYQTIMNGARSVNHYINMSPRHINSPQRAPTQYPLKLNQQSNQQTPVSSTIGQLVAEGDNDSPCTIMTQSKMEGPITTGSDWSSGVRKFTSLPRFKKIDFSPLKLKINNVLQRNHHPHRHHTPQQQHF